MVDDRLQRIRTIQETMVQWARASFSECELEALCVLIRLATEFNDYLHEGHPDLRGDSEGIDRRHRGGVSVDLDEYASSYSNESTFSGIDFFCTVTHAYRVLMGAAKSEIEWPAISATSLKVLFISTYTTFDEMNDCQMKCRVLLDLFKIQLVFAGVTY
jgi:hypothetical protein